LAWNIRSWSVKGLHLGVAVQAATELGRLEISRIVGLLFDITIKTKVFEEDQHK
jgi:hypothetical protein